MTEQLKKKYLNILNLALGFERFKNIYNKIENNFTPTNKEKLQNLEEVYYEYENKGKDQWQIIQTGEKEVSISLKKFDTSYRLALFNLPEIMPKNILDVTNKATLDENSIAFIEVHNVKKGVNYFVEIVVAKENDKTFLVEKDWTYSYADQKWEYQFSNIELDKNKSNIL